MLLKSTLLKFSIELLLDDDKLTPVLFIDIDGKDNVDDDFTLSVSVGYSDGKFFFYKMKKKLNESSKILYLRKL